jgi:hypothetical protein
MNNEQQHIIDEAYKNYWISTNKAKYDNLDCLVKQEAGSLSVLRLYYKEEFINKIKTNTEFSEKWGLKIEERELSEEERWRIRFDYYPKDKQFPWDRMALPSHRFLDDFNIPRRLITITYNDKTIESYE